MTTKPTDPTQDAQELAAAMWSEFQATGTPQAKADAERWEARAEGRETDPPDAAEIYRAEQARAIWRPWPGKRGGVSDQAAALARTLAGFREDLAIARGSSRTDLQRAIEDIEAQLVRLGLDAEAIGKVGGDE